jgi:hypothetical protein
MELKEFTREMVKEAKRDRLRGAKKGAGYGAAIGGAAGAGVGGVGATGYTALQAGMKELYGGRLQASRIKRKMRHLDKAKRGAAVATAAKYIRMARKAGRKHFWKQLPGNLAVAVPILAAIGAIPAAAAGAGIGALVGAKSKKKK